MQAGLLKWFEIEQFFPFSDKLITYRVIRDYFFHSDYGYCCFPEMFPSVLNNNLDSIFSKTFCIYRKMEKSVRLHNFLRASADLVHRTKLNFKKVHYHIGSLNLSTTATKFAEGTYFFVWNVTISEEFIGVIIIHIQTELNYTLQIS